MENVNTADLLKKLRLELNSLEAQNLALSNKRADIKKAQLDLGKTMDSLKLKISDLTPKSKSRQVIGKN